METDIWIHVHVCNTERGRRFIDIRWRNTRAVAKGKRLSSAFKCTATHYDTLQWEEGTYSRGAIRGPGQYTICPGARMCMS